MINPLDVKSSDSPQQRDSVISISSEELTTTHDHPNPNDVPTPGVERTPMAKSDDASDPRTMDIQSTGPQQWSPPQPPIPGPPLPSTRTDNHETPQLTSLDWITNPLHDQIVTSPYAPLIPQEWFLIVDPPGFSPQSRHSAEFMRDMDPALMGSFVRADLNILLQFRGVGMYPLRAFFRDKYALSEEELAAQTNIGSIPRLMAIAEEVIRNRPRAAPPAFVPTITMGGFCRVYYHSQTPIGSPIQPRSDWLIVAAEGIQERLRLHATAEQPQPHSRVSSQHQEPDSPIQEEHTSPGTDPTQESDSDETTGTSSPSTHRPTSSENRDEPSIVDTAPSEDYLEDEQE